MQLHSAVRAASRMCRIISLHTICRRTASPQYHAMYSNYILVVLSSVGDWESRTGLWRSHGATNGAYTGHLSQLTLGFEFCGVIVGGMLRSTQPRLYRRDDMSQVPRYTDIHAQLHSDILDKNRYPTP
ncbi:hypothetical protein ABW21_db0203492 [Orbilia brochopaga]|nr:hypothetical protein ABW21_db0203492 [Drechslerella brochopaga]